MTQNKEAVFSSTRFSDLPLHPFLVRIYGLISALFAKTMLKCPVHSHVHVKVKHRLRIKFVLDKIKFSEIELNSSDVIHVQCISLFLKQTENTLYKVIISELMHNLFYSFTFELYISNGKFIK